MDEEKLIVFFKKRIEPFIAVAVLVLLLILCFQLYQGNNLRTEISQSCGWGEEDFHCFCEKSEAMAIKNRLENNGVDKFSELINASMDR